LLALIEELGSELTVDETRVAYERADSLLSDSQHPEVLTRLRRAAARVIAATHQVQEVSVGMREARHGEQNSEHTWEDFSLKEQVRRLEERYIRRALEDSEGRVSQAAKLLGFDDHGSLNSLLKNKYPHLSAARLPPSRRKRSIIRR
jgi:DNA-binding NtrC family response regulator